MKTMVKVHKHVSKEEMEKIKQEKKEKRKKRGRKMLLGILIVIILCFLYGRFVEPNIILVDEHKITTNKISNNNHGLKIVHFTDLHYGGAINKNNIEKLVNKINFLKPDIVVFTGDLVEENVELSDEELKYFTDMLKNINTVLGKYAVIGNHDYYNKYANNVLFDSGFKVLNNDYDLVYNKDTTPIVIYGVDDTIHGKPSIEKLNEKKLDNYYKILLVHEPDYIDEVNDKFDLVLAGHSHNGQFKIPGVKPLWLPIGSRKYYDKYYKVNNTDLYVSNGVGTSGIDIRFASIPSINFFRITNK